MKMSYPFVTVTLLLLSICICTDGHRTERSGNADVPWSFVQPKNATVNTQRLTELQETICPTKCSDNLPDLPFEGLYTRDACLEYGCGCSMSCHDTSRCCANQALGYLKTSCVKLSVQIDKVRHKSVIMVTECPSPNDTYAELCKETNPAIPAYSDASKLTYQNAYCALCHGDETYVEWKLTFGCSNLLDDTLSLSEMLLSGKCYAVYIIPDNIIDMIVECTIPETPTTNIIGKCNETGLWINYDKDIEFGCDHLNQQYLHFKNVFCYICNPSLLSVTNVVPEVIRDCPPSVNDTIVDLCTSTPKVERLYPYKNPYCLECNKNTKQMETFEFKILETVPNAFILNLIVNSTDSNELTMLQNLTQLLQTVQEHFSSLSDQNTNAISVARQTKLLQFGSTANLRRALLSKCGERSVCMPTEEAISDINDDNSTVNISHTTVPPAMYNLCAECSCDDSCYLSRRPGTRCCLDKILSLQPYICLNDSNFPLLQKGLLTLNNTSPNDNAQYKVIDTCLNLSDTNMVRLCEDRGSDFMTQVPIRNIQFNESNFYKNIYCMLCNVGVQDFGIYVQIECGTYVEADIIFDWMLLLRMAKDNGCRVQFTLPYIERDMCNVITELSRFEHVCFIDGLWENETYDRPLVVYSVLESLADMCEISFMYKALNIMINTTSQGSIEPMLCILRPDGENKTILEEMCKDRGHGGDLTYRMLFALSRKQYEVVASFERDQLKCAPGESLDIVTRQCVSMLCPNLRVLRGDTCVHLIETAIDLYYIIRMGFYIDMYTDYNVNQLKLRLLDLCGSAVSLINSTVETIADATCKSIAYIYTSCGNTLTTHYYRVVPPFDSDACVYGFRGDGGYIVLEVKLFVTQTNERTMLENNIVQWLDTSELSYEGKTYNKTPFILISDTAIGFCRQKARYGENNDEFSRTDPHLLKKTAICPMVTVSVDDIMFSLGHATLIISSVSKTITVSLSSLHYNIDNNKYSICKDEFDAAIMNKAVPLTDNVSSLMFSYLVFSYSCNILSLVSIFATLLTYILFPVLRSIPGKNNMTLAASLFVAQTCMQLQSFFSSQTPTPQCTTLGILIHYFWLATFCAMFICCFHMVRIFSSIANAVKSDQQLYRRYAYFVVGLPLLVVCIVVCTNAITSNGTMVGYGSTVCFIDGLYNILLGFIIPSCTIFAMDIFFFVVMFYNIRGSPTMQRNHQSRRDLVIYVKLCSVTGITWPLLFIDGLFELSAFSFVATLCTALQGFSLFWAFICNERVFGMYRYMCCRNHLHADNATSVSTLSTRNPSIKMKRL